MLILFMLEISYGVKDKIYYTYDNLNRISKLVSDDTTHLYEYDFAKEDDLVNNLTKEYTYDNYGNILSKKTYTYNTTNLIKEDKYEYKNSNWQDLLTKFNNESITYDEIGNPTSIGNKKLTWMNGRELSSYSDGTNNISYKYNLNGIRTSKVVNDIKTNYILEGTSIIFEDRNGNMIYYIYNGDELLGFVYKDKTYYYYYHKNMFGDIIGILDSNYNEIVTYEYDSWGALVNVTDNSNINLGTINPFRYRSYYYDEETQLYYLNSRYYNLEIGRFINADGYVSTGQGIIGNNMYVYCNNNFINLYDNNGFLSLKSIFKSTISIFNYFTPSLKQKALSSINKIIGTKNTTSTSSFRSELNGKEYSNGTTISYGSKTKSTTNNENGVNLSKNAGNLVTITVNTNINDESIEAGLEFNSSKITFSMTPTSFEIANGSNMLGGTLGFSWDYYPTIDVGAYTEVKTTTDKNGNFESSQYGYVKANVDMYTAATVVVAALCPTALPFILLN